MEVKAQDLDQLAGRRDAPGLLPEILRRLIRATTDKTTLIRFPAGDSISRHGLDGTVESESRSSYVPKGISFWEVTTQSANITSKATEDYPRKTVPGIINSL